MKMLLLLCCLPLLASAGTRPLLGSNQPCWEELRKQSASGEVDGASKLNCDRLGRYAPRQCQGSECYCVDPEGNRLADEAGNFYTMKVFENKKQECRCARVNFEIAQGGNGDVASLRCDGKGDYHPIQCREFQVDTITGEEVTEEKL